MILKYTKFRNISFGPERLSRFDNFSELINQENVSELSTALSITTLVMPDLLLLDRMVRFRFGNNVDLVNVLFYYSGTSVIYHTIENAINLYRAMDISKYSALATVVDGYIESSTCIVIYLGMISDLGEILTLK